MAKRAQLGSVGLFDEREAKYAAATVRNEQVRAGRQEKIERIVIGLAVESQAQLTRYQFVKHRGATDAHRIRAS